MKLSARNQLKGKVTKVEHGAIDSEVTIEIAPGIEVVAQITSESIRRLGLAPGKACYAVVKADSVMVGTD